MYRKLILVLSLTGLIGFREVAAQNKESFDGFKLVDETGNIRKPDDYHDLYQMIGYIDRPRSEGQSDALHLRVSGNRRALRSQ